MVHGCSPGRSCMGLLHARGPERNTARRETDDSHLGTCICVGRSQGVRQGRQDVPSSPLPLLSGPSALAAQRDEDFCARVRPLASSLPPPPRPCGLPYSLLKRIPTVATFLRRRGCLQRPGEWPRVVLAGQGSRAPVGDTVPPRSCGRCALAEPPPCNNVQEALRTPPAACRQLSPAPAVRCLRLAQKRDIKDQTKLVEALNSYNKAARRPLHAGSRPRPRHASAYAHTALRSPP